MFDLANDRLSYGELLRPEAGYTLDSAVGMTYSLDLEALLGVPVSLGMLDEADEGSMNSPLFILEAIRKSSDRITLFCNTGCIKLPDKIQSVYSLLENSVFQVKLTPTSNFHPKLWVLKYSQEGCPSYIKLIVMSRNLTFDNSIDISAALRGELGTESSEKNRPLADFLRYVSRFAAGKKKQQVLALAEDVQKVAAFEVSPPFEDYDFFPIGIPGYSGKDFPLFGQKYDFVAISPFLSDQTIQRMTDFKGPRTLVTRKSSVTPAVMEAFDHQVYVTKEVLSDNEFGVKQDIHAKIYYATTRNGNYLYLGSANASRNAFSKNIECLLRLRYKLYGMGYNRFSADFIPSENCPYEKLTALPVLPAEDSRKNEIEKALKEAVYALKHATVLTDGKQYTIHLEANALKSGENVRIAPLQRQNLEQRLGEENIFRGMLLKELSEFYALSLDGQRLIAKVRTSGIPKERDQAIYRSIIDTRSKFMSYLSFVLSGDLSEAGAVAEFDNTVLQADALRSGNQGTGAIYEQMLRVFHQNPSKLKGIADMIQRLDPEVVGDTFRDMFSHFETAAKKVRK